MAKIFLGKVVRLEPKKNGAYIRPSWGEGKGADEDLFVSFKESPKLEEGLNVSFELGRETKTGRWCCQKVSLILENADINRPDFLPSARYLDLMRQTWKRTHNKDEVLAIEKEFFNDAKSEVNTTLTELGVNINL